LRRTPPAAAPAPPPRSAFPSGMPSSFPSGMSSPSCNPKSPFRNPHSSDPPGDEELDVPVWHPEHEREALLGEVSAGDVGAGAEAPVRPQRVVDAAGLADVEDVGDRKSVV